MVLKNIQAVEKKHHASGSQKSEVKGFRSSVSRFSRKGWLTPLFSVFCLLSSFFAGTISGCATSARDAPSMQVASVNSNSTDAVDNDEFDLLEEEYAGQMVEVPDPLEPFNRVMFNVNDTLYFWIVKPGSEIYAGVVPEPARIGIYNFFSNLTMPARFVNCLLQGKGDDADTELHRFAINTTCGILGFGDPALDQYGLEPVHEDLGQTLAVYGFGDGFYLVLPLLGPSNARDSVGRIGDWFLNPVSYVEPTETAYGITAVRYTNSSSLRTGEYETFKSMTVEPYIAMREAYIQYRTKQIQE
jgi:phospholipid-binding lipoprotein MlaA